ncbi:YcnI family protein [Streptomyces sp. IBSBF 2953]|nr:YcnI family protein [Streptomyces hayashii]
MSIHPAARAAGRPAAAGAAALTAVLTLSDPASAHAEVAADIPRALARNVTLTFVSEAESDSAGFQRVRVVLPDGIAPGDVTLADAPRGWKLKATSDGYTVAGPALTTGTNAEHKVRIRRLPDARQLVFKTVETYADGEISRWIELPTGGAAPEQPAPVLEVMGATESAATSAGPDRKKATGRSGGASAGLVAVPLLLAAGAWWLIRRRDSSGSG